MNGKNGNGKIQHISPLEKPRSNLLLSDIADLLAQAALNTPDHQISILLLSDDYG